MKTVTKIQTADLTALSLSFNDDKSRSALRFAIADRTRNIPTKFNPAICDSLGVKGTRRARVIQKTPVDWDLPGHGAKGKICGKIHSVTACENADYFRPVTAHCWRFACPTCWWDTAGRKAAEISERLDAFDGLCGLSRKSFQHIVVSPPQDIAKNLMGSQEGYAHMRVNAIELARQLGIEAGVVVFHPYRENGEDDYNNRIVTGNDGTAGHWRTAPHFHIVGYGWMRPEDVKTAHKRTGWVVKSIQPRLNKEGRIAVLNYVLTHVGIGSIDGRRNIQTYQYFGRVVPAYLVKVADLKRADTPPCPNCKGKLLDITIKPKELYPTEYVPHKRIVSGGIYCWKKNRPKIEQFLKKESPNVLFYSPEYFREKYPAISPDIFFTIKDPDEVYIQYREPPNRGG